MEWTVSQVPVWRACFWCLCTVMAVVRAACPDNALQKVMMCTSGLGLGAPTPSNAFIDRGQIEVARLACRDNKLLNAINCVEEITRSCQGNSDQEHYLRNMIDVGKAREYITSFCSNLIEYEKHAPCIAKMHPNLTKCISKQRDNMETKVKASDNMDYLMTSSCKYLNAAVLCSKQVLSESCSRSAAEIVAGALTAFKPPTCDPDPEVKGDDTGSGSRFSLSKVTFIVAVFVWSCFLQLFQ